MTVESLVIHSGLREEAGEIRPCAVIEEEVSSIFFEQLQKLGYEFHGDFAEKNGIIYKHIGEGEYKRVK